MTQEIRRLWINGKPLPKGTRLKFMDGKYRVLSEHSRRAANSVPNHLSEHLPFWILGWKTLHYKLLGPTEPIPTTETEISNDDNPEGVRAQETVQRTLLQSIDLTGPSRKEPR